MNEPHPTGHWPERLLDGAGLPARLETELQGGLRECARDHLVAELAARRAARRALEELDARRSRRPRSVLSWGRDLLRPRMVLAALVLALLVQLGDAMAEEIGPRAAVRIGHWLEQGAESALTLLGNARPWRASDRAPAPTTEARRDDAVGLAAPPGTAGPLPQPAREAAAGAAATSPPLLRLAPIPSGPAIHRRDAMRFRQIPAPAASPDRLAHEAAMVSLAVALEGENPTGALGVLSEYWRDYPAGALRGEAAVAEVSALRSLGKNAEALARLDGWAGDRFRGMSESGDELALMRLELMVGAGRCTQALPLLERRLAVSGGRPASRQWGRALLAHAACRGKLGDADGNRADLERYLRELPDGPRAAQVRRALGSGD